MNFSGTLRINKFACFILVFILFLIVYWRTGAAEFPSDKSDLVNLKSLLKAAIQAAERGGKKVKQGKDHELNVKSKGETLEGANDPVTDADYASHCAMYYALKNTFSKLTIVSEEHSKDDSTCADQPVIDVEESVPNHESIESMNDEHVYAKDVTIWIDPLDATQEYTGMGVPIIGVIHYPFTPRTFWGWYTKKPSANILNVEYNEENKHHPKVVVSRSHPGKVAELSKQAFGSKTTVATAAGAGYKVMGVVNGTYDVYLHATAIKKWDLCAGDAIIKTVNGRMTTTKGDIVDYSPDGNVKVSHGILVTRFDHDYYLSKMTKEAKP
ncbi:putative bisphosphate nucleotidase [Operophtera brumata]|uniref:inositol-phosphate phosphatase n=1 Tax=Operophtera brumata TaxID=104452 RepID=A0A0L7KPB0_OPEBR|nr:putative bisphosphate nucleotidase [Operophtera brumata]